MATSELPEETRHALSRSRTTSSRTRAGLRTRSPTLRAARPTSHGTIASTGTTRRTSPGPLGALARGPGASSARRGEAPPHSFRRSAPRTRLPLVGRTPPHSSSTARSGTRVFRCRAKPLLILLRRSAPRHVFRSSGRSPSSFFFDGLLPRTRLPLVGAKPLLILFDGLLRDTSPLVRVGGTSDAHRAGRNDWRRVSADRGRGAPGSEGPRGGGAASRPAHHGRDQPRWLHGALRCRPAAAK